MYSLIGLIFRNLFGSPIFYFWLSNFSSLGPIHLPNCSSRKPVKYLNFSGKQAVQSIWSEWRLTVIAATVRIALVDILDLPEVDIPAGGFLYPAVGWG